MCNFPCVHHVEIGTVDGPGTVEILKMHYDFKVTAFRLSELADQWLLVRANTRFLVTCLKTSDENLLKADEYLINWADNSKQTGLPTKDSVFNIAFQVKNIDAFIKRLENQNVPFSKSLRTASDSEGSIRTCAVKSFVGDVHHTLIEKEGYSGFLPGFTTVSPRSELSSHSDQELLLSFDHAALAVEINTTASVIDWYERCFGMKRFLINRDEETNNGLVLATDNVGLRLRAMEYWKCAEVGLLTTESEDSSARLSMVVAEGLPPVPGSNEENQVESWIRQHGGPGIQHIAVNTPDIKAMVARLKLLGATFANPPPDTYYSEIGRLHDIIQAGENVDGLKENGILIDTEADGIRDPANDQVKKNKPGSYLLQIFTRPILSKDPFFMELIQREGATGFGSGNVAALYRSVQAYIVGSSSR